MTRFVATYRMDAPANRVWDLVSWLGAADLAGDAYFRRIDYAPERVEIGGTRTLVTDGRPDIVERLLAYDEEARSYDYGVVDAGDLPLADYQGTVTVLPAGPDACLLSFACDCIPVGMTTTEFDTFYRDGEDGLADAVRARLKS